MAASAPLKLTTAHNLPQCAHDGVPAGPVDDRSYVPRGNVRAILNYYSPPEDGSPPFNYVEAAPEGRPQRNFGAASVEVTIHDIRGSESQ